MKIVITGAQVAGKSSVIEALKQRLPYKFTSVKFKDESAIEVIDTLLSLNLTPQDISFDMLQKAILGKQLPKEQEDHRSELVILDRAARDGMAYMPSYYADKMKEISLKNYDAVILLTSVALADESLYRSLVSTTNRINYPFDEVKAQHEALKDIYKDHPRFIEIPFLPIEELCDRVEKEIEDLYCLEVEQKLIVPSEKAQWFLQQLNASDVFTYDCIVDIEQSYLTKAWRLRKETKRIKGQPVYCTGFFLDYKSPYLDGRREKRRELSEVEYQDLLDYSKRVPLKKTRVEYKGPDGLGILSVDYLEGTEDLYVEFESIYHDETDFRLMTPWIPVDFYEHYSMYDVWLGHQPEAVVRVVNA